MIQITGDPLTRCYMTQQISVALQRSNAASVLGTIGLSTPFDSSCNFTHTQVLPYHYLYISIRYVDYVNVYYYYYYL